MLYSVEPMIAYEIDYRLERARADWGTASRTGRRTGRIRRTFRKDRAR